MAFVAIGSGLGETLMTAWSGNLRMPSGVGRGKLLDQMSDERLLFAPANYPFRP
jgi:hypothetical protein